MVKEKNKPKKIAFCFECGKEVPIVITKVKQLTLQNELLQIGQCGFCFAKITLVESADVI